jgi:hypothetical protein
MLGARVELPEKYTTVASRYIGIGFDRAAHTRKLLRRHDHKKLITRFRKNDEFFGAIATPAGGDGNAIFLVDGMSKFTGVEELSWRRRIHVRQENSTILTHFSPLLTTFRAKGQSFIELFFAPFPTFGRPAPADPKFNVAVEPSTLSVLMVKHHDDISSAPDFAALHSVRTLHTMGRSPVQRPHP